MANPLEEILKQLSGQVVGYLPNLLAGTVLIATGWFLGWLLKRITVQILSVLRIDRILRRFRWGGAFARADVRSTLYAWAGDAVFLLVFLILLNAALDAWKLTTLSMILSQTVGFIPKLVTALLLLGLGWIMAGWIGATIQRALLKERIPRPGLITRFSKTVLMLFFSAMALAELDIAREVVIIGFAVTMVTLGAITVVVTSVSAKTILSHLLEADERE